MKIKIILFNLFETLCIFSIGWLIGVNIISELIILMLFSIPRQLFNGASHYKNPYKCFVISLLLGTAFMLIFNVNDLLGYVCALFSGCILTEKGNISNIYQWNKTSKYQDILDYVRDNPDNEIIKKYEKYMENNYPLRYKIYILKYKKDYTIDKILDELILTDHKIVINELNIIYDTLKFYLNYYE